MKSHPIIMQPHLAQAAFEGRKTVTRRIGDRYAKWQAGDQIWIREKHAIIHPGRSEPAHTPVRVLFANDQTVKIWSPAIHLPRWAARTVCTIKSIRQEPLHDITEADAVDEGVRQQGEFYLGGAHKAKKTPKVFPTAKQAFADLWASINGPGSWDQNPKVWRIEFEKKS